MPRIPQDRSAYRDFLLIFHEEEVVGEAYFANLARTFLDPGAGEKLHLLSRMERCVVNFTRPLLTRHGLRPRSDRELHDIGSAEAERRASTTWQDFIAGIETDFPVFLEEFAALARVAPAADLPRLKIFDDHEIAVIDFAKRERAGDPDSAVPLTEFLQTYCS